MKNSKEFVLKGSTYAARQRQLNKLIKQIADLVTYVAPKYQVTIIRTRHMEKQRVQ